MTPLERYLFTLQNVEIPPVENPTEVDIEVVGWATDWPSVQLQMRIAGFLNQLFGRVGELEETIDPEAIAQALAAAQETAAEASTSAAQSLTEAANAASAAQAASVSAAQASTNALAALGHAQSAAAAAAAATALIAAMEERLVAIENRLAALEASVPVG